MHRQDAARVAELLQEVRRLFKEQVSRWDSSPGLPVTNIVLLREIGRDPGISVSSLGRRTGLSKGYVSGVVDQMEEEGLLHKSPDPRDQRCLCIELTDTGAATLSRLFDRYHGFWSELLAEVSEDEAAAIIGALESLRSALAAHSPERRGAEREIVEAATHPKSR